MIRHTPNILSAARIFLAIVLLPIYAPYSRERIAFAIIVALLAILTDLGDGFIARRYGVSSKFGYVADGLGDRAFHVSIYLVLLISGALPLLLVWLLIFREISQYACRLADLDWHATQSWLDRAVTRSYAIVVQIVFICEMAAALYASDDFRAAIDVAARVLLLAVAIASYSRIAPRLVNAWRVAING